ncbi:TonB-dependent receptor [Carboxylicivirga sp. A043]|uniref:TonB-dependent receptor plug domain-containing protein n=1 Tax=Carboxylicivirga litoralis TaxID=2816963 RepID=UPI0021CB8BF2|nr:TonB-dependent receptor plug domain-containing protein [Carboxylicivirga sp. A043]MCU4158041.1 TonB-dependent receptor [Carboxylicivirga sp. A043]
MRCQLLILFLVLSLPLLADDEVRDSVKVQEVEITASRLMHFAVTEKVEQMDTLMIQRYATQDLGALLQRTSPINIQSNGGVGGLATASIRGASSNQTLVTWNGLPINSLTTGSADLSTVNVGGFNDISIVYGASGSLYGSGTMGGVIELSNQPQWGQGFTGRVRGELGSFSNYKGNLLLRASNQTLSYNGQFFYHDAKNNFKYVDEFDYGKPEETLTHNENTVIGTIHNLYWKAGKNLFDFGAWYQVKEKNLPGLMGVGLPVSHQTQKDSTLKTYIGWKRLLGNCRLEAQTSYMFDFLRYTDREQAESESYKIYSEITTKRWLSDLSSRWYLQHNLSVDINGRYSYLKTITANYAEEIAEHEARLNAAIKYSPDFGVFIATVGKDWCNSEANEVEQAIYEDGEIIGYKSVENKLPDPPVMFSLSGKLVISPSLIAIRGKVATHFRRPTFNERYWNPGGNILLQPEEGYNIEVGLEFFEQETAFGNFGFDAALYWANNDEAIAWKPTTSGLWQPINTGAMISQGADIGINHKMQLGRHGFSNKLIYGYNDTYDNNAQSDSYKETLGYRPKHTFKLSSDFIASQWNAGAMLYSRSKCYTWEGRQVDAYALVDVNAGYTINITAIDIHLMARIENVFNTSYQLVRAYPMPGRAYYLTVNINF